MFDIFQIKQPVYKRVGRVPTCDAAMRDWSRRGVRSDEETLAGAPRWSLMATFLSLSARSALPV